METMITTDSLSVGYENKTILSGVSLNIGRGEFVGIIGPNGAGKSTLVKTLRGMLAKRAGSVRIMDTDTSELSEREFARRVAYLQQHVEVSFGYTGRELVLAGRYPYMKWWQSESEEDERIAELCMQYTGVTEFADTPVQEVSGGQRQRILLAKVLAQQTPILFLDEPTTGLDMVYQEEIFRFCKRLCEAGKTVVMVVHELPLASRFCSRLVLVGNGRILADGKPDEVIREDVLSDAYHVPIAVVRHEATGSIEVWTKRGAVEEADDDVIRTICGDN
ncbi:MAG: ABC transporter ATP-binding protein [Selenomonadales bacterium]|jgi:iron complex transport system ATP-binding protein|nr:ABC transporter ATP-binding protein [Selenomonadales bacterium]